MHHITCHKRYLKKILPKVTPAFYHNYNDSWLQKINGMFRNEEKEGCLPAQRYIITSVLWYMHMYASHNSLFAYMGRWRSSLISQKDRAPSSESHIGKSGQNTISGMLKPFKPPMKETYWIKERNNNFEKTRMFYFFVGVDKTSYLFDQPSNRRSTKEYQVLGHISQRQRSARFQYTEQQITPCIV